MGTSDIDAAVEREMRRQAETEHVPYPDDPATGSYGDRAECAVCGVPLDRPPEPDGLLFCERHDRDDLRAQERHADERRREALEQRYSERQS